MKSADVARFSFKSYHQKAAPSFADKVVAVSDFLPSDTFWTLLNSIRRRIKRTRVHLPIHKRGAAISYHDLHQYAPELVAFYQSPELHGWCSFLVGEKVVPTPLNDLSSCSVLIYERPGDHIRWHYDVNFYRGRHFTALLSLVNSGGTQEQLSSASLIIRQNTADVVIPTPPNTLVLFEGAFVYHGVTPLKERERRLILSMTFCTDPSATRLQTLQRRFKDVAYFGLAALWSPDGLPGKPD